MEICDFRCKLCQDKYQIHRVGSRDQGFFDFVKRVWLWAVLRCTFQNGFQPGCILKLLV